LADDPGVRHCFWYIKDEQRSRKTDGRRQTTDIEETKDRRTEEQTKNRRGEGACQRCVPGSGKRVSNGEAIESIGLSAKVILVKQNKESRYFLFHQPSVENPFI